MYILRYYLRQLFNRVKSNLSFWQNISDLPVTEPSFMCSLKKLELEKQWSPKHQKKLFKRFLIHVKTAKVFLWKGQVAYCFNQGICDKSTITYCIFPHANHSCSSLRDFFSFNVWKEPERCSLVTGRKWTCHMLGMRRSEMRKERMCYHENKVAEP